MPCSVKAYGSFLVPPHLDITFCDIMIVFSSSLVIWFVRFKISWFGQRQLIIIISLYKEMRRILHGSFWGTCPHRQRFQLQRYHLRF